MDNLKTYGIIGYPLSHSFSNKYFTDKFSREAIANVQHKVFPLTTIQDFPSLIESEKELVGLNVTIPYKQTIIPFLDELDTTAKAVGAVNTIKVVHTDNSHIKKLVGYNTDVFGFANALKPFLENHHQRALILGTGGASKALAYVLKQLGIDFLFVSRNKTNNSSEKTIEYSALNEHYLNAFHLIINATPAGMFPAVEQCPLLPYEFITSQHLLFDLIYNPEQTLFLQKGKAQGAATQNGLTMLYLQAEQSWKIWNE